MAGKGLNQKEWKEFGPKNRHDDEVYFRQKLIRENGTYTFTGQDRAEGVYPILDNTEQLLYSSKNVNSFIHEQRTKISNWLSNIASEAKTS